MRKGIFLTLIIIFFLTSSLFALTPAQEQELFKNIGEIRGQVYQINKRFEAVDKRFDDMNKRFDQLHTFLWILSGIFTTLVAVVIGFAYWDRRTILTKQKKRQD